MIIKIGLFISLLLLVYLNVSGIMDIEYRLSNMGRRETILRFGWSVLLLVLFACTFLTFLWENT